MAIETERFIRKPLIVESVRLTNANFDEVVSWCQGEAATATEGRQAGKKYIKVRVHNPKHPRQTQAFVGDWLLYTEKGYKIYTNKAFKLSFDLMEELEAEEAAPEFPRVEGDTIVLGPQCFVAADGSVLNWNGVNYVPQAAPKLEGGSLSDPRLTGDPVADIQAGEITESQARENLGLPPVEEPRVFESTGTTSRPNDDTLDPDEDSDISFPRVQRNGKRVLTKQEQEQMGPEAVRELIMSGEAVLEQDAA